VRREAKYLRRTPRASELPASEIYERIPLDFGRSAGIPSVASDDDSEMAERATSTVTQDPLHEAIASILPGVQPGLFPKEICDRLFVKHKGLISKRCKNFASLKSMIHRILSAMLGQKKLERRSAKTRKGYLGHQYIRTGPCGLHKPRSSEGSSRTVSSEVEFVDSYSMASTSCLEKPSHAQRQREKDTAAQARIAITPMAEKPYTEKSIARAAAKSSEQTLLSSPEIDSESLTTPEARTIARDHRSIYVALEPSKTRTRGNMVNRGEHTQFRETHTARNLYQRLSSPYSAPGQEIQMSTNIPEHSSQTQGSASRGTSPSHRKVSAPNPQEILEMETHTSDVEYEPSERSLLPLHSHFRDVAATPASSNDLSTEAPRCPVDREQMTTMPASLPSTSAGKAYQCSDQEAVTQERSSTFDISPAVCDSTIVSPPSGRPSETDSVCSGTIHTAPYVYESQTATVAHEPIGRGYPTQGQMHTIGTAGKQNPILLPKRNMSSRSQGQLSLNTIRPKWRPDTFSTTPNAGTQAPVTNASGILYDTLSGPVPVQPSDTKFQGSDTSRDPRPRLTPDMRRTLHPSARTPKLQSGSSSSSAQQRIVEDLQTEWKQSIDTLIQKVTPSPGVTAREQDRQNSDSGNLVGQAQHAASVGLTGMSEAPEGTPNSTRTQAICEDHSVLELGKMIREVGKKRQKWVDDAKSFDQKLRNDEQVLDKLLERMNANMKELCRLHAEMETLHSPVESLESKVVALRRQADQTRDTATTVTLQCQAHVESKREAEMEFAKADRRLERLVQALIKL
jgi:hypothetical protein